MCGQRSRRAREATFEADGTLASDRERDEVLAQLRAHAGEGRLSVEELDERAARALTARTRADLARLTGDLPRPRPDARRELAEHVRSYVAVMTLLVVIWALTGAGYFWPVWPMLGWGIGVASHAGALRRPASSPA